MSPTSTDQTEVKSPPQPPAEHDTSAKGDSEGARRRGLFERSPRAKFLVFGAAILVLLAVGWYWLDSRNWENTDDAEIDGHIYPISARVGGQVINCLLYTSPSPRDRG